MPILIVRMLTRQFFDLKNMIEKYRTFVLINADKYNYEVLNKITSLKEVTISYNLIVVVFPFTFFDGE